jgi:NitT/TauT family transport system substrate-binding protein
MAKVTRRTVVAGSIGSLVAPRVAFPQGSGNTRVRFAIDWVWQGNHSVWTLAADQGLFVKEKLDAVISRGYGSADNLTKLAAGALDIALVDINLLAKFNIENPGVQMVSPCIVYDAAPGAITFLRSSGIKTAKDLEGKKLAITEADASWPLFRALCQINDIDLAKIEIMNISPQLRDTMVIQKRADAALGYFVTAVLNMESAGVPRSEIGYLQYSKAGLPIYSLSLVCKKDYAAANPATVAGFTRGTIAGIRAMLADRKAAVLSILRRDPLLKEAVETDRNNLVVDDVLLTPWVRQNGISTIDRERLERTTGLVAAAFGITAKPKLEDIYTDTFLPPLAERKVV